MTKHLPGIRWLLFGFSVLVVSYTFGSVFFAHPLVIK